MQTEILGYMSFMKVAGSYFLKKQLRWIVFICYKRSARWQLADGLAYGFSMAVEALFIGIVRLLNFWIIAQAVTGECVLVTKFRNDWLY